MIYHFLKIVVSIGIRLFYKQILVKNQQRISDSKPTIIIANHPNTLMDAWMIGYICNQKIYYMAKGTFFSSPFKRWILTGLGLIPVNRQVDSNVKGVSNADSFEACYKLLEEGKTLVIFPEGNSFQERLLRKLKSGTARIALQTELRNKGKLGLQVIPVGLVYSQPEKFRSSVLATVGEPITVIHHLEEFETDSLKAARKLTAEFRDGLSKLLVSSEEKKEEELVENIVDILSSDYVKTKNKGVERDVSMMRKVFTRMNSFRGMEPWKIDEVKLLVENINFKIEQLRIKSDFLDRRYRSTMFIRQLVMSFLVLSIALPVFLYGLIHNFIQYKVVDVLVLRFVKEVEYYAPVAILFSLVLYPLVYITFLFTLNHFVEFSFWMKWVYFFSMPLSGLLAYYYVQYYRHVSFKRKYILLMRKQKADIEVLKEERGRLRNILFENY